MITRRCLCGALLMEIRYKKDTFEMILTLLEETGNALQDEKEVSTIDVDKNSDGSINTIEVDFQ